MPRAVGTSPDAKDRSINYCRCSLRELTFIVVVRSANLRFDRGAINDYTTVISRAMPSHQSPDDQRLKHREHRGHRAHRGFHGERILRTANDQSSRGFSRIFRSTRSRQAKATVQAAARLRRSDGAGRERTTTTGLTARVLLFGERTAGHEATNTTKRTRMLKAESS